MNLAALPHDVELTLQIITGIVIFLLQCVNLGKSIHDGKRTKDIQSTVVDVDASTKKLENEVATIQASLDNIKGMLNRRSGSPSISGGRRSSDPPPMRESTPKIEGISPVSSPFVD